MMRYLSNSTFLAFSVALLSAGTVLCAENHCGSCHPKEEVQFESSIHRLEGISCDSCHGGDPLATESGPAHEGEFFSLKDRRLIPDSCATCHSDPAKMRPYNIPADQKALYDTSHHGESIAQGDENAAVCSDCHGSHRILPPRDPESPVHPQNVPQTCAVCHADVQTMESYGIDPEIPKHFEDGVHGRELLTAGNDEAPDCARCHGAHGAAPPGIGDINKVCGSCHTRVRWAFVDGPHYEAFSEAGLPECASCHGKHATRGFEIEGAEALCLECHDDGSNALELSRTMLETIEAARSEVDKAADLIEQAERVPLEVEDYRVRVAQARASLLDLPAVMHSALTGPVEDLARRARSIGREVQEDIHEKLRHRAMWRIALVVVWFYVLMTVAVLIAYKSRLGG